VKEKQPMRKTIAALVLALLPSVAAADFDLADNYRPNRYTATASQTTFAGTWPIEADAQVKVYVSTDGGLTFTLKTLDSDYEVTGEGESSGFSVVFDTGLALGSIVVLDRDSGVDRSADLTTIEPTGVNTHFDRNTMHDQETEDIARRRGLQIFLGDDYNNGDGDTWIRNSLTHTNADVAGDPLCMLAKADPADGWRLSFCKGSGGGACADCPPGECDGGDEDGEACASEEDCPGGECVGFTTCDYIGVSDGQYTCQNGTCPDSCGGDQACLDCGDVGTCEGGDNDGSPCTDDGDCPGGTCVIITDICFGGENDGDPCTQDTDCAEDGVCRPDTNICWGGSLDGESCTDDGDCAGLCTALACVGGPDDGDVCATNGDCTPVCLDPDQEICDGCDPQRLPRRGGIPALCEGGVNTGDECSTNTDCTGGECVEDVCGSCGSYCVTNGDCGDGCICDLANICFGGTNDGDPCTQDTDCAEDGVCAPENVGETCQGGTGDGDPCTDDADCPGGGRCEFTDAVGVRMTTVPAVDSCVTVADGTSGAFIECSRVLIGTTGFMRNLAAIQFTPVVSTDATQSITWQYPPSAVDEAEREEAGAWYLYPTRSPLAAREADSIPPEAQWKWIASDPEYDSLGGARTPTYWTADTHPFYVVVPGAVPAATEYRFNIVEPIVCPGDLAGSLGTAQTAFTGTDAWSVTKNGTEFATATPSGSPRDDFTFAAATNVDNYVLEVGDYLGVETATNADATGADVSWTLKCYRSSFDERTP
jgi:hypothetical protein